MILERRYRVIGLPKPKIDKRPIINKIRYINILTGKAITPSSLTLLMYDLYEQKQLKPILPQKSQYRMAKKFIEAVGKEKSVELMFYAASVCKNVWTFKFLFTLIQEENIEN